MVMRSRRVRTLAAFGILVMLASTVAGCGRRGRLEPPPNPDAPPPVNTTTKSGVHKRPRKMPIVPPTQPFVLDPLL